MAFCCPFDFVAPASPLRRAGPNKPPDAPRGFRSSNSAVSHPGLVVNAQSAHFQEPEKNSNRFESRIHECQKCAFGLVIAASVIPFGFAPEAFASEVLISNESANSASFDSTSSSEPNASSSPLIQAPPPDSRTTSQGKVPASVALGVDKWPRFRGDGFAVRVPPGFENITPVEDVENVTRSTLQSDESTPFVARFSSPDGNEIITVVVRPTTQIKLSFFEIKDVKDLGSLSEVSSYFTPPGAKILAQREFQSSSVRVPKTYFLYEFVAGDKHVAMSVAIHKGKAYVLGAACPQESWRSAAGRLRATAGAFALVV